MEDEVDFLPANKHEGFLHVDSITLGLFRQAFPNYSKQWAYNSLQYLKENVKDELGLLPTD